MRGINFPWFHFELSISQINYDKKSDIFSKYYSGAIIRPDTIIMRHHTASL